MRLCGSLSILWHCLSLILEGKLTFSSPVATAEFSKFAGVLSAALSEHHLVCILVLSDLAVLGFSYMTWGLSLCCMDSLVGAPGLSSCGIQA